MAASDAKPIPRKNVAHRVYFPILDADGDPVADGTGLLGLVSTDAASFVTVATAPAQVSVSSGVYFCDLSASEMNGDGVVLKVTSSSAGAKATIIVMYPQDNSDIRVNVVEWASSPVVSVGIAGTPKVDVSHWLSTAAATPTVAGVPEVDVTHWIGTAAATPTVAGVPEVDVTHFGGSAGTFASGVPAVNSTQLSGDSTAADNAEAFFDGTGYKDVDNFYVIRSATAQSATASTIGLDTLASAVDDFYNNTYIQIISGTGVGQSRFISDYVGATKVATVNANWVTNPDNTSVFIIWPFGTLPGASAPTAGEVADAVWDEARSGHTTGGSFGQYTNANVTTWDNAPVSSVSVAGVPKVDVSHFGGSAGTFASGVPAVNSTQISGDSTAADNLETAFDDTAGSVAWTGIVDQGTAQSVTATTIQLRAAAAFANDELIGATVVITGGTTGVGQSRVITDYVSASDTATIDPQWTTTPTGTITYKIFASAPSASSTPTPVNVTQWSGATVNALVSGRVDASVGAMAANVMTAAAAAADLTTELQTGLATAASLTSVNSDVVAIKSKTDLLAFTSGSVAANVLRWDNAPIASVGVSGVPKVDVSHWLSTAAATPTVAGVPEVDVTHFGGSAGTFASGVPAVNSTQISGASESADRLERSTLAIVTGTVGVSSTTTSIIFSSLSPTSAVNDQFKGRIITFDKDTTTTALRGQATDITAYTHATLTATVTALTTAPVSGDTCTIT